MSSVVIGDSELRAEIQISGYNADDGDAQFGGIPVGFGQFQPSLMRQFACWQLLK